MTESILRKKSYLFAVEIVLLVQKLQQDKKEYILTKQIIRSGTSIGANIREAEFAQSEADFIHKMSISLKEANETIYWLDLLKDTDYLEIEEYKKQVNSAKELLRMLISTINTMKNKKGRNG